MGESRIGATDETRKKHGSKNPCSIRVASVAEVIGAGSLLHFRSE